MMAKTQHEGGFRKDFELVDDENEDEIHKMGKHNQS